MGKRTGVSNGIAENSLETRTVFPVNFLRFPTMSTVIKPTLASSGEANPPGPETHSFPGISSTPSSDIPAEARASLEHLLASDSIARAPRIRSVVKFLVDALLEGRAASINEQMIGQAVFDRPAGFNPGDDNIVRVTMRHLRERLEEFYRTEGRGEKYILTVPRGKYVPVLNCVQPTEPPAFSSLEEPLSARQSEQVISLEAVDGAAPASRKFRSVVSWILVFVFAATSAYLASRLYRQSGSRTESRQNGLLSLLSTNGKPITVVVTDSNLEAYRMIFRKTVSLDDYIDRSYFRPPSDFPKDPVLRGAWKYVDLTTETSLTSSIVASEIQIVAGPEVISVKHPHDLSMRDFQHGNYILLGGPWINPWGQLFESRLNFRFIPPPDNPSASSIHNMKPLPPEPAIFAEHQEGALTINYARVALVRNLSNDGYVILIGATSPEAIEAGGRFIVNQGQVAKLMRFFKVSSPVQLPSLEVVLQVRGLQSVPEDVQVVAEREVKAQ